MRYAIYLKACFLPLEYIYTRNSVASVERTKEKLFFTRIINKNTKNAPSGSLIVCFVSNIYNIDINCPKQFLQRTPLFEGLCDICLFWCAGLGLSEPYSVARFLVCFNSSRLALWDNGTGYFVTFLFLVNATLCALRATLTSSVAELCFYQPFRSCHGALIFSDSSCVLY